MTDIESVYFLNAGNKGDHHNAWKTELRQIPWVACPQRAIRSSLRNEARKLSQVQKSVKTWTRIHGSNGSFFFNTAVKVTNQIIIAFLFSLQFPPVFCFWSKIWGLLGLERSKCPRDWCNFGFQASRMNCSRLCSNWLVQDRGGRGVVALPFAGLKVDMKQSSI